MTALTLPGDIPGLLRRGSPVLWSTNRGVVVYVPPIERQAVYCVLESDVITRECLYADIALDLSDPTGRAHAAWFIRDGLIGVGWDQLLGESRITGDHARSAYEHAINCIDMLDDEIDILRRVVLHLAGRT